MSVELDVTIPTLHSIRLLSWNSQMERVCRAQRAESMDIIDLTLANGDTWDVYVAMSVEDRTRGLAGLAQEDLGADGMLFYFPRPSWTPFTVAAMKFDLHIAWYDNTGSMIKQAHVAAGDLNPVCSPRAFTWVLESPHPIPPGALRLNRGA